ncbi:hypothetical protein LINPERHAP2_LOCUS28782 [Linum perenne]
MIGRKAATWASHNLTAMGRDSRLNLMQSRRVASTIALDPGPLDGVTVNTDGSVQQDPNRVVVDGINRTSDGKALGAFVANLGNCLVTRA